MGREITQSEFTIKDYLAFTQRLEEETKLLQELYKNKQCSLKKLQAGFEIEACLVDKEYRPAPKNEEFVKRLGSDFITYELAKFNFEINNTPHPLQKDSFSLFYKELQDTFSKINAVADEMNLKAITIGILPTLKEEDFCLENMSAMNRYKALNEQILKKRHYNPLSINIVSEHDALIFLHNSVMLEAAATSFQVHTQVPFDKAHYYYNASIFLSPFMVAVSANSPFLFKKRLWQESRIPLFEQSVDTAEKQQRVSFGSGYIDNILEPFLENIKEYDILLPLALEEKLEKFPHLKLHNGSIWRWNRALVGEDEDGVIHFRIEHRVMPSGPTLKDMLANALFFYGLEHIFALKFEAKEPLETFEEVKSNFYKAAKYGLDTRIVYKGQKRLINEVILDELLTLAKEGLEALEIDEKDIKEYLGIIERRVESKQNGASWQCKFVDKYGDNMQELTKVYLKNQLEGEEVSKWEI